MSLSEKKLFCDTCKGRYLEEDVKETVERFIKKLKECDEFFNVKNYEDTHTTDKFMGIVELFLRDEFGEKLIQKTERKN